MAACFKSLIIAATTVTTLLVGEVALFAFYLLIVGLPLISLPKNL